MKYNSSPYDDEIDLIASIKIIWNGKKKILLITIISFLVGFGYNYQLPKNYLHSLTIKPGNTFEIAKLDNIQKLLNLIQTNQSNLDRFIKELEDYEELSESLKNTTKVKKNFITNKIEDQEIELFKYVRLFKIHKLSGNEIGYTINFEWHDSYEAKKVLKNTLELTSKNLRELINLNLLKTLEFKKKVLLNEDKKRLAYLKEQSGIAKELNIINNQIDNVNLSQSNVSLNISTADVAYYLRGYKAIDKEIELIKKRDYQHLKFIEQELNSFKKENIKFAIYNIHLMNVKSLKNTKLILSASILFGLIVGIFYVLISNAFQLKKISKKNN